MSNPHGYEQGFFTIEQHRDELIDRLGEATRRIASLETEATKFLDLVCKYQCNPTWKLSSFEAIRNHLETTHRLCNENYDWAKRLEAENQRLLEDVQTGNAILAADVVRQYQTENDALKDQLARTCDERDIAAENCVRNVEFCLALGEKNEALKAERDEFERKGIELSSAYGNALITMHDLHKRSERLEARLDAFIASRSNPPKS